MEWINTVEDFRLQELCKKAAALTQNKTMAEVRGAVTGTEKGDRIQETNVLCFRRGLSAPRTTKWKCPSRSLACGELRKGFGINPLPSTQDHVVRLLKERR